MPYGFQIPIDVVFISKHPVTPAYSCTFGWPVIIISRIDISIYDIWNSFFSIMLIRNQYFRKNPAYPMAGRIIALPPGNAKPLKITSNIDDLAFTVISIYEISAFTMRTRIISAFRQKYSCQTSSTLLQYTYLNREFQRYGVGQNNSSGTPFLFYSQKTVYRAISRQASGSVYGRFKSAKTA